MKKIKPKLYGDENFPLPVIEELRRLGHDVVTIQDTGKGKQGVSDEAVLAFAIAEERAVLTINRKHFIRLHRLQPEHAGIIVCRTYALTNYFFCFHDKYHRVMKIWPTTKSVKIDQKRLISNL